SSARPAPEREMKRAGYIKWASFHAPGPPSRAGRSRPSGPATRMVALFPKEARMATRQTQLLARTLLTPAIALLFIWMIVPLALTIYFSTLHYNLLDGDTQQFVGLE